mmetsp:Transcript_10250/g.21125  ORF Transcript_10250/g.21125 Transcript_10250/m.21125 type:complete len:112 (-) Transcript_10250:706-1041(-)
MMRQEETGRSRKSRVDRTALLQGEEDGCQGASPFSISPLSPTIPMIIIVEQSDVRLVAILVELTVVIFSSEKKTTLCSYKIPSNRPRRGNTTASLDKVINHELQCDNDPHV